MALRLAVVLVLAGCIHDSLVPCGDLVCPASSACDLVHATCVSPGQLTACASLVDGDVCSAGSVVGRCDQNVCLPACGDGAVDTTSEECDDGNFKNHDGCSSACVLETAAWSPWTSAWIGRNGQNAGYDVARDELVVVGGGDETGSLDDQWTRNSARQWLRSSSTFDVRLASVAYMPGVGLVLFGGVVNGVGSNGTYVFDGTSWVALSPATSPSARYSAAMAYDPVAGKLVLFGGRTSAALYGDTWTFDGTTWTSVGGTQPGARYSAAMAWDDVRGNAVLIGGVTTGGAFANDMWTYSAGTWTLVTNDATQLPPKRFSAMMAFSPATGTVVLFGGQVVGGADADDTWQWDGVSWTSDARTLSPAGRSSGTLTYDPTNGVLVLVGGVGIDDERLDDVWEFAQTGWKYKPANVSPSPRESAFAYDALHEKLVMFSGLAANSKMPADTWTFDGDHWLQESTTVSPPGRYRHSLGYDALRGRTVLFGGADPSGDLLDDTWEWDGTQWTTVSGDHPGARSSASIADADDGRPVVLFGGLNAGSLGDTWTYDGAWTLGDTPADLEPVGGAPFANDRAHHRDVLVTREGETWAYADHVWTKLDIALLPPRANGAMTYDPWRERVVLYGGASGGTLFDDVWELDDDAWTQIPISGTRPPLRLRPAFAALPGVRALVLFGGRSLGDTWFLRWESRTPDEDCANSVDDDGDLFADAADPDCQ